MWIWPEVDLMLLEGDMVRTPLTLEANDRADDGRPISYRVLGLPHGASAGISELAEGQWQIWRVSKLTPGQEFQPPCLYASAEAALAALQEDLIAEL